LNIAIALAVATASFLLIPSGTFLLTRLNGYSYIRGFVISLGPILIIYGIAGALTYSGIGDLVPTLSAVIMIVICVQNFWQITKLFRSGEK